MNASHLKEIQLIDANFVIQMLLQPRNRNSSNILKLESIKRKFLMDLWENR